jgi:alanine racemase
MKSTIWVFFEAGISTINEMENGKGHSSTIGILTNIGSSHDEGFLT